MKIGLFAPGNYSDPTIKYSGPSLGLGYIASSLKEKFSEIEEVFLELDAERLIERKPDLVGISAFTYAYGLAIKGSRHIRAKLGPDVPIILGGPHVSSLPENLDRSMDLGVIGEGEAIMEDLVQHYMHNQWRSSAFREVPGLIFWNEQGELERSNCGQRVPDLDALPLPDRDLMSAFWPEQKETITWMPSLSTSRGCPFTCGFCMYSKTANLVRYHSVDRVIEDIEDILRRFPTLTHIRITDDLFVTKKSRLKEIADQIRAAKLHTRVTFGCMAKSSFFDEEYAQILKSMNVAVISFGYEAGSDPVLHYLKDKKSSVAKNQKSLDLCRQVGIHVGGYFIIGAPPETRADLAKTYWFIEENKPVMPVAGIFPLIATPGTAVWAESRARGLIDPDYERWDSFNYNSVETGQYLHLNQHYSFEELSHFHRETFAGVKRRSSFHLMLQSLFRCMLMHYYTTEIYPTIQAWVAKNSQILEIHRGDMALQHLLEQDYALESVFWNQSLPAESQAQTLLLTHTLEKIGFQSPLWRQIKALNKPLLLVVENMSTWAHLVSLLKGWDVTGNSLEQTLSFFRFSLKTLTAALAQEGYEVVSVQKHRLPHAESDFVRSLTAPFDQAQFPAEADFFSYPMLMHVFKGFANPELLSYFQNQVVHSGFETEADIFSYTVMAVPLPQNRV
ncbi:MAG: cobalamin-dependent protein [Candidatus Sericytochromatia bacterium]